MRGVACEVWTLEEGDVARGRRRCNTADVKRRGGNGDVTERDVFFQKVLCC